MRTRSNKLINFILEISQVLLVFLGVYTSLMCVVISLELTVYQGISALILFAAAILFYAFFTVLETFRKGKLFGILGIAIFYMLIIFRFFSVTRKGFVTVINSFLKKFMNYTGTRLTLFSYTDTESASVRFCATFFIVLLAVLLIAVISAFFYRRRHPGVYLAATVPWVLIPLTVGVLANFSYLLTYLIVTFAVIGTRHIRTDATDRRMRQKLSFIMVFFGILAGGISFLFMPPDRYERGKDKIIQTKNSMLALTSWETGEVFTWFKSYFNEDAITYGKIGKKSEIVHTGETMLKMSGMVNSSRGMYLKGYVGDIYEDNKWSSLYRDVTYASEMKILENGGITPDNWHIQLRNELGDAETSGVSDLWGTSRLRIRNLAFGYGNYLVPYLPETSFKSKADGRSTIDKLGIDYTLEYYINYPIYLRQCLMGVEEQPIASMSFWDSNKVERQNLKKFVDKYYLQVPESLNEVCDDFKDYLNKEEGNLLEKYKKGSVNQTAILRAVKRYITKDTKYTLSPGKTPSDRDSVEYFLKESKKGYCVYYATAAAILLRSVGIPTRYVEGMYVKKEQLKECAPDKEIDVPDSAAHAWVEVFHEKYGFVPMEVTPGYDEEDGQGDFSDSGEGGGSGKSENDEKKEEAPKPATPTPIVTEVPEESMEFEDIEGNEEEPEKPELDGKKEDDSRLPGWLKILIETVVIVAVLILLLELQRRLRRRVFQRNLKSLRIQKRIRAAYHHLAVVMRQKGVVYRGQPVAQLAGEMAEVLALSDSDMYQYVSLVYRARFGPDDIEEEQEEHFREIYEKIRTKIYTDAKIYKKLYYMYIIVL